MGWLTGWSYRKRIKISAGLVSADLTNFPITLHINSAAGRLGKDLTAIFDELGANKLKIAITTDDGITECPIEIDYWDDSGETAVLHFMAPALDSTVSSYFYLYYDSAHSDNTTYAGTPGSTVAQSVWDSNFHAVFHMNEDPSGSAPQILDSTSNGFDLTTNGSMTTGDLVDSKPGKGIEFDGVDDHATKLACSITDYPFTMETAGPATIPSAAPGSPSLSFADNSSGTDVFAINPYDGHGRIIISTSYVKSSPAQLTAGVFAHLAGVFTANNNHKVLTNGDNSAISTDYFPFPSGLDRTSIGGVEDSSPGVWEGQTSEVRISDIARSDDWLLTTYRTLNDTLITWYDNDEMELTGNWAPGYSNRITYTVDSSLLTTALTDFPVMLHVSSSSGINAEDLSDFFTQMSIPCTVTGDTFTGNDGDPIDPVLWLNHDPYGLVTIQNNKMTGVGTGATNRIGRYNSNFLLRGDFDIQISNETITVTTPSANLSYPAWFGLDTPGGKTVARIARSKDSAGGTQAQRAYGLDVSDDIDSGGAANYDTMFRLTRVSGEIRGFVWDPVNSQWEWDSNTNGRKLMNNHTDDLSVRLIIEQETGGTIDANIDNFVINSGTVVWGPLYSPARKQCAVTGEDGITILPVEVENFDWEGGNAAFHVKVPVIPSTRDTKIYLYYDPNAVVNDLMGDTASEVGKSVWDDDYISVYHLNQDPEGSDVDDIFDSKSDQHGESYGTMTDEDSVDGPGSGKGMDFDGSNDYIEVPNNATHNLVANEHTLETVVRRTTNFTISHGDYHGIFYKGHAAIDAFGLRIYERSGAGTVRLEFGSSNTLITEDFANGEWKYIAGKCGLAAAGSLDNILIDGVEVASYDNQVDTTFVPDTHPLWIGSIYPSSGNFKPWDGIISEVRISNTIRSDAWLNASYHTLMDTFLYASVRSKRVNAWLTGGGSTIWKYRMPITVNHASIEENLTNFPLTVQLSDSAGITGFNASHFFEELGNPDLIDDDFTGTNDDPPDTNLWFLGEGVGAGIPSIQSNAVQATVNSTEAYQEVFSRFALVGDFDIQVDFDLITQPWNVDIQEIKFILTPEYGISPTLTQDLIQMVRRYLSSNEYALNRRVGGTWDSEVDIAATTYTGQFRFVRIGDTVTGYYWLSGAWSALDSRDVSAFGDTLYVVFGWRSASALPTMTASFDNFVMNSGVAEWPASNYTKGKRVAFTLADHVTQLYAELEHIDFENKIATYHVLVPSIGAAVDTVIWLYYDEEQDENTGYIGYTCDAVAQNVWDSDFEVVMHMGQDPSGSSIFDSTSNEFDLTSEGTMLSEDLVESQNGAKAIEFDGGDDRLEKDATPVSAFPYTFESIVLSNASHLGTVVSISDKDELDELAGIGFRSDGGGGSDHIASIYGYSNAAGWSPGNGTTVIVPDTWYGLSGVFTSGTNKELFLDGVSEAVLTTNVTPLSPDRFSVGRLGDTTPGGYFNGKVSEVRVSSIARSDAWIKATYKTLFDTLATISEQEMWLNDYQDGGRIAITVDSNKIDADLIDFPVPIVLNSTNAGTLLANLSNVSAGTSAGSLTHHAAAKKIAITDANGNKLQTEVGSIDFSNNVIELHTLVHNLPADEDTLLYVYYDYTAPDNDMIGFVGSAVGKAVWNSDFVGVWHLADLDTRDSTRYVNDGTVGGNPNMTEEGGISGIYFDEVDDVINMGSGADLDDIEKITVETFIYPSTLGQSDSGRVVDKATTGNVGWSLQKSTTGYSWQQQTAGSLILWKEAGTITLEEWQGVSITFDHSSLSNNPIFFKNGGDAETMSITSGSTGGSFTTEASADLRLGKRVEGDREYHGIMADVRISKVIRSDAWIKTTYLGITLDLLNFGRDENIIPIVASDGGVNIGGSFKTITFDDSRILVDSAWKSYEELWVCIGGSFQQIV